jgi:hypothetical protein
VKTEWTVIYCIIMVLIGIVLVKIIEYSVTLKYSTIIHIYVLKLLIVHYPQHS